MYVFTLDLRNNGVAHKIKGGDRWMAMGGADGGVEALQKVQGKQTHTGRKKVRCGRKNCNLKQYLHYVFGDNIF